MKIKAVIQNTLTYDLNGYKDEVKEKVVTLIDQLITQTNRDATRDAPRFVSIDKRFSNGGLTGKVGILKTDDSIPKNQSDPAHEAMYFEFGTGLSASQILAPYPQWVKDIAYEYYVNGEGTLIGKPYLFNNFLKNHEVFERDLNALLEKEFKK